METAGIIDLILNSLALTFILDIDENMFTVFASDLSKHVMKVIEPFRIKPDHGMFSDDHFDAAHFEDQLVEKYKEELHSNCFEYLMKSWFRAGRLIIKLVFVILAWWT